MREPVPAQRAATSPLAARSYVSRDGGVAQQSSALRPGRQHVPADMCALPRQPAPPAQPRTQGRSVSRHRMLAEAMSEKQAQQRAGSASRHAAPSTAQRHNLGTTEPSVLTNMAQKWGGSPMKVCQSTMSNAGDSGMIGALPVSDGSLPAQGSGAVRRQSHGGDSSGTVRRQLHFDKHQGHDSGALTIGAPRRPSGTHDDSDAICTVHRVAAQPPPAARVPAPPQPQPSQRAPSGCTHYASSAENCGAADNVRTEATSPALDPLAGYSLGKVIGEGGFCQVRAGMHELSGRHVAVKVINKVRRICNQVVY
jgi:hypothetical protein